LGRTAWIDFNFNINFMSMAKPKIVTMVELRRKAGEIVGAVRRGQPMLLSYRGRPVLRLEPIRSPEVEPDDLFYSLAELGDRRGRGLSNREIDAIVYGG
jgi:prevent-host-death family protein